MENVRQKLRKLVSHCNNYFLTKTRTALNSPRVTMEIHICSHVVNKITFGNFGATYIGQAVQHLATKVQVHDRKIAPRGEHFKACEGHGFILEDVTTVDQAQSRPLLQALDGIYTQGTTVLDTKDGYRNYQHNT